MSEFKVGDRVRCPKPRGGLKPYAGTVSQVFTGFVRVDFDTPQGPAGLHKMALTDPGNLVLITPDYVVKQPDYGVVAENVEELAPLPPYTVDESPVPVAVEDQVEVKAEDLTPDLPAAAE